MLDIATTFTERPQNAGNLVEEVNILDISATSTQKPQNWGNLVEKVNILDIFAGFTEKPLNSTNLVKKVDISTTFVPNSRFKPFCTLYGSTPQKRQKRGRARNCGPLEQRFGT